MIFIKIGISWVSDRIALTMNISEAVKSALSTRAITQSQALIISQLVIEKEEKDSNKIKKPDEVKQDEFLRILLSKQGGRDQPKYLNEDDAESIYLLRFNAEICKK